MHPNQPQRASTHAVERYIERHRPGLAFKDAQRELLAEARAARFHEQPRGSDALFVTPRGALLVVSGAGTIKTVLPLGTKKLASYRPRKAKGRR